MAGAGAAGRDLPEVAALIAQAAEVGKEYEGGRVWALCGCQSKSSYEEAEIHEFQTKLRTLRHKQEFWKMQVKSSAEFQTLLRECSADVGPIALAALRVVEDEQSRRKNLRQQQPAVLIRACLFGQSGGGGGKWSIDFLIQLTEALQAVIDAFNSMPKPLKDSNGVLEVPIKIRRHARLPFQTEKNYVPLRRTATRIRRRLENPHGPQVVLVHGSPGSGLSSLARYLALQYQDGIDPLQAFGRGAAFEDQQRHHLQLSSLGNSLVSHGDENRRRPSRDIGVSLNDSTQFSAAQAAMFTSQMSAMSNSSVISEAALQLQPSRFPGGVFYVPCVPGQNIVETQLQLLQDLGFTPPIGKLSHLSLDEIRSRLRDKVMEYLGKREALVVVDNASDPTVMRWLLLRGSKVKYLVTTQDPRLFEQDCDAVAIPVEKLRTETARKILATRTRLNDSKSQEVLDAIINLTAESPAALRYAAMTVLHTDDLDEWRDVRNNLETLGTLSAQGDPQGMCPREIPRHIGCAIVLALESLPQGVENLLVALAVLEGPAVPQVVVQLLVKSTEGSLSSFSRSRNVLEDRCMIRLRVETVWWSSAGTQTTGWYIDDLLQKFIQVRKARAVAAMLDSLFHRFAESLDGDGERDRDGRHHDSDYALTVALCAVYGSPSVAERAARALGASVHRDDLPRIWAAPLVSLLQATEAHTRDELRRQEIHSLARQVFLAYVHDENPDRGMRGLLVAPAAIEATCWSVAWAVPNQKRALFARSAKTLRGLVTLLAKEGSPDVLECATAALWNMAMAAETKTVVARAPGVLEKAVRLLDFQGANESVKRHAVGIVASLASERENQEQLARFPGLVPNLVRLLTDYSSCNVQVYSTHAFMHLASHGRNKELLVSFPGALEGLVELLQAEACVHEIAVGAVMNLSISEENKPIIAKFPGALEILVRLMAQTPSLLAQKRAAASLVSLSTNRKFLIRLFPAVLERLVGLLAKMESPELQEVAAKILGNLAVVEENAGTIGNFPGAWQGLLRLLSEDVATEVQIQALDTVVLLAAAAHTSKAGLSGVAMAVNDLLGLVGGPDYGRDPHSDDEDPDMDIMEKILVAVFRILDSGDGKNFVDISRFPRSLTQLVQLLVGKSSSGSGGENHPDLQGTAAAVLASLAKWKQNRMAITTCPGALDGLVDLLADDSARASAQAAALKTLWHCSYREDENRKMIAEYPDLLQRIVALLEKDAKPTTVQVCAALVLSSLAGVEGEQYVNPEEVPDALEKLGALLAEESVSPSVQQEAAKARTLLDWETSNLLSFTSSDAYAGRGRANAQLGMLQQALSDFDVALRSMWDLDFTLQKDHVDDEHTRRELQGGDVTAVSDDDHALQTAILHARIAHVLSNQAYVKAVLKDYEGALKDADDALGLQPRDNLLWQERGVLKRLMGDLPGALADLETSLQLAPNDYETLKHCGFVYFLQNDLTAAYATAERALEIDLDQGYDPPDGDEYCRLGKLPVSYLDFILR